MASLVNPIKHLIRKIMTIIYKLLRKEDILTN